MSKHKPFDEEELRKKIRDQLARDHRDKELKSNTGDDVSDASYTTAKREEESYYIEIYLRSKLEEEVYGSHPEFIKCINHLNQIKWLTPLEMESEFEFYPIEETFWEKIKDKFSRSPVKIPNTPEIKKMIEYFRNEMKNDAQERIKKYKEHLDNNPKNLQDDLERKIFQEEQDRFYSKLKGYHKYKNHLGEEKWMTEEEFKSQDEYIDRVYSTSEKIVRFSVYLITAAVVIVLFTWLINYFTTDIENGYLLISSNEDKTNLYINQNLAVGFTPGTVYPVPPGESQIAVLKPGFETEPGFVNVDLESGDTISLSFKLQPVSGATGTVIIKSNHGDAGVFIDGEFKGMVQQSPFFTLPEGQHTISLEKENYISLPQFNTFELKAGDTVALNYSLSARRSSGSESKATAAVNFGLIEVSSNVRGAEIILNGQRTGFFTDYVLQKIPYGRHVIRLEKEGYEVYPQEQVLRLDKNQRNIKADFTLTATSKNITINVYPENAKIFIADKEIAQGKFSGSLPIGKHQINFSDVEGYVNPGPQTIEVSRTGDDRFDFRFGSDISFTINPQVQSNSSVVYRSGHILNGISFSKSSENGPDLITTDNGKAWNLGFAFQYRNPPGTDAIAVRFRLPNDFILFDNVYLKLWIYDSNDDYPLVINGQARYRVILNNSIITDGRTPASKSSEYIESDFEQFNISNFLQPGINNLIISTSENNSAFLRLYKIAIE